MSDSRQAILGRVREALRVPSDPHVRRAPQRETPSDATARGYSEWLPIVDDDYEAQKSVFAEYSEKLKTAFICVPDREAAMMEVEKLAADNAWSRVACHDAELPAAAAKATGLDVLDVSAGYDATELEQCNAGITGCDALIAQTGSVLVTTMSAGGRALSVLPEHHVAIATRDQLVADLPAGYALLHERYSGDTSGGSGGWPSFISFITGPSRTGDIERILVLGAHGPKQLTVILIEQSD